MPKAAKASVTETTRNARHNPHLPRNQACHQCRKKKLKCDAGRPCSTCVKAHAHKVAPLMVKGQPFDPNPSCTYDEPADESSSREIGPSQTQPQSSSSGVADTKTTPNLIGQTPYPIIASEPPLGPSPAEYPIIFPENSRYGTMYSFDWTSTHEHRVNIHEKPDVIANLDPSSLAFLESPPSLGSPITSTTPSPPSTSQSTAVVPSAYSPTLPPAHVLLHLVDLFFHHVSRASRLIHRPSFLAALHEGPNSPRYPAPSLLHAICAIASIYSPDIPGKPLPDLKCRPAYDCFIPLEDLELEQGMSAGLSGSFGVEHASVSKALMEFDIRIGARLFDSARTMVVLCWYYHINAQWVDLWMMSSSTIRGCVSLGLNVFMPMGSTALLAALQASLMKKDNPLEQERRRFLWWSAYMNEIHQSLATHWVPSITEALITQELPGRLVDYESGNIAPGLRQRLSDVDILTNHPAYLTDPFTMHLKACILMMKVGMFNIQTCLHRQADIYSGAIPSDASFTPYSLFCDFSLSPSSPLIMLPSNHHAGPLPVRDLSGFASLDNMIIAFQMSIPKEYRDPWAPRSRYANIFTWPSVSSVDHDLYCLNVLPHIATMILHEPHAEMLSSTCNSKRKIINAARAVLDTVHILFASSYDPALLPSYCVSYWMASSKVLLRAYKAALESGLREEAEAHRGGIEIFRLVLAKVGEKLELAYRSAMILTETLSIVDKTVPTGGAGMM
ncbi:uncharacterized protein EI90DRAFT_3071770 [Cantharellus anzutake]|uniref:uncharacterized protein n=1 Tax=Cantharellus anzutake TaxID=1750568 RepID=UPI0019054F7A|nr:uncharacterized protein EI90DRAFT_3071770 [Cantharellus anzutake]KAF8325796.1 hypothetical protein EI90DRAFT_3071770 [Cantharellus anzutake]